MTMRSLTGLAAASAIALVAATGVVGCASVATAAQEQPQQSEAVAELFDYLDDHNTTGFVVLRNGEVVLQRNWAAPRDDRMFANFVYGTTDDGQLLEDVASQQKSFVAVLIAIAVDRGLIDIEAPVSTYLGEGWSRASRQQEAAIRVIDIMTMSSGLNEQFGYVAPAGTTFFYNTPVYAVSKRIVAEAAGQPLDVITREWLTGPVGMSQTAWRRRPAALASVGNDTGLVTTPMDVARFGQMILNGGVTEDGTRVVSEAQLQALFTRSDTNPAYGRLWWLNGGSHTVRAAGAQIPGPLIPAAPADTVAALGAFDRRLYVAPSQGLVVVRTGAATNDAAFDQQLWLRLNAALD